MPVIVKDTMFGSGSEVEVAGETLIKAAVPTFLLQGETKIPAKVLATGTIGQNRFANVRLGRAELARISHHVWRHARFERSLR
jgi:hypothetical protein